jgi:hypothetical protein
MGYKVQFEDGTHIEFDSQPSQQDIDDAHSQIKGKDTPLLKQGVPGTTQEQDPSLLEYLMGAPRKGFEQAKAAAPFRRGAELAAGATEATANLASGGAALPLATVPAALQALDQGSHGDAPHFLDNYENAVNRMTYEPKTEAGQEIMKPIGEAINRYALPVAPILGSIPFHLPEGPPLARKMKKASKAKEPDPEAALAREVDSPLRPLDIDLARLEDAERPLYADQRGVVTPTLPDEGMRASKAALQGLEEVREGSGRDMIPPSEGEKPIYVDPQGQAFRGDPASPDARLGLERQGEAMDTALDHPEQLKPGQPLQLLNRDQLRSSNEGVPFGRPEEHIEAGMRAQEIAQAIEDHPLMQSLEQRIQKQEELITKLQMSSKRVVPSRIAREVKNLENLEKARERTRQRVEEGISSNQRPVPFNFKKQGGAINPDVFKEGFEKLKKLGDGTWLRAYFDKERGVLRVEASKDSVIKGEASFSPMEAANELGFDRERPVQEAIEKPNDTNLTSSFTHIDEGSQKKGYATEIYKFASELGNDVKAASARTPEGKAMWNSFERSGLAKDDLISRKDGTLKSPGNKQRGALLIDPKDEGKGKFLADHPNLKLSGIVPDKYTPDTVKELVAKGAEDVKQNFLQRSINYFTKGGLYQALKTGNPFIRYGVERVLEQDRLYRGDVQTYIHDGKTGLAPAARALSKREAAQIWELMNKADKEQRTVTEDGLRRGGYTDKQIEFWKRHTEGMNKAFEALNEARKAAGFEPIDKRVSYAAMRATGDFKRLVFSDAGRTDVVGVIGSDFSKGLDKLKAHVEGKGYYVGEQRYYAGTAVRRGSPMEQALQRTLEALADKDPRVMDFMTTVDEIVRNEAYSMLNMKKHTLGKKGVFGMEGRKDWLSAEQNAKEGIQSQLDYMDGAFKWAHISKAAEEIRPLMSSDAITEKMPKAKEWMQKYLNSAMGYNPTEVGQGLSQAVAAGMEHFGVGYSAVRGAQSAARKTVNSVLLGLNPMFWLTNVVQPMRAAPGMKAYLTSKGLDANFDFGTGWSYLGKAAITDFNERFAPSRLSAVEKDALTYARTHHVYGSDLVEHSHRASKDLAYKAEKVSNFAAGAIETSTRKAMYLAFVDMLHDNGLSVKNGLYESAHNLTDMTMNNYSRTERPQIYNAAGPLGDLAANLSSFKHNELSRVALFARQIAESKTAKPLGVELAASIAFSGIMGLVAFDVADSLYKLVTKMMGHPDSLKMRAIKLSEATAKGLGADKDKSTAQYNSQYVLSHGVFSLAGADMSNRLGLNNILGSTPSDIAFPGVSKLADIAGAAKDMVYTNGVFHAPSEMDTKRLVREASPGMLQGPEDLAWFSKNMGQDAHNRKSLEFQVKRNTPDVLWKSIGGTGIHESVQKDLRYEADAPGAAMKDRRMAIFGDIRDTLFTDNKVDAGKIKEYIANGGDAKSLISQIEREAMKQNIPRYRREMMQSAISKSVTKIEAGRRVQEAYENQR